MPLGTALFSFSLSAVLGQLCHQVGEEPVPVDVVHIFDEVAVVVEEIMPPGFMDYLINVINVNRFTNEKFRYHYILEDPITRKDLYKILKEQLSRADMDNTTCFQNISLQRTLHGAAELDMECNEPFFLACKDSTAKLVYTFQDGREETLVIEY